MKFPAHVRAIFQARSSKRKNATTVHLSRFQIDPERKTERELRRRVTRADVVVVVVVVVVVDGELHAPRSDTRRINLRRKTARIDSARETPSPSSRQSIYSAGAENIDAALC